jgi:hypothetical protein
LNPLDEGFVYMSSTKGFTFDTGNNRLGLNKPIPAHLIDFVNTDGSNLTYETYGPYGVGAVAYSRLMLEGLDDRMTTFTVGTPTLGLHMGILGNDYKHVNGGAISPEFGRPGDAFIYSAAANHGLNIISEEPGAGAIGENYIRLYAGMQAHNGPASIHIEGYGSGFVGFSTNVPTNRIDLFDDTIRIRSLPNVTNLQTNALGILIDGGADTFNIITASTATTTAVVRFGLYVLNGTGVATLELPNSPADGDSIKVSNLSGLSTNVIEQSSVSAEKIMGSVGNFSINSGAGFQLIYSGAADPGWVVIGTN